MAAVRCLLLCFAFEKGLSSPVFTNFSSKSLNITLNILSPHVTNDEDDDDDDDDGDDGDDELCSPTLSTNCNISPMDCPGLKPNSLPFGVKSHDNQRANNTGEQNAIRG